MLQEAKRKAEERERKKAEVRKRLEEAGSKKKAKKGFLTPERKKKLRVSVDDQMMNATIVTSFAETSHDQGCRRSEATASEA